MRHHSWPVPRRAFASLCAAIAAHVVVLAALVLASTAGIRRYQLPHAPPVPREREERVTFVSTTVTPPPPASDDRTPARNTRRTIVAHTPPSVPFADADPARTEAAAAGTGAARSPEATPARTGPDAPSSAHALPPVDARLFTPGLPAVKALRSQLQLHDSVVNAAVAPVADSLTAIARSEAARERTAWTRTTGSGAVWGIDRGGFRLGRFTLGAQMARSNDGAASNAARLQQAHDDIERMAYRTQGEAAFRKAVDDLRARNDKLHEMRQARGKAAPP